MKTFKIVLADGRTERVIAETYTRDGEQYVFHNPQHVEVQFFNASDVTGITIEPPLESIPLAPRRQPRSPDQYLPGAYAGD